MLKVITLLTLLQRFLKMENRVNAASQPWFSACWKCKNVNSVWHNSNVCEY